ncbi:MAG: T9SS type A sorting domain-containing protein, partial [Crocinitomicaceae bacterium]
SGGTGFPGSAGSTNAPTSYLYGGDPGDSSQWSEYSMNNPVGDRRMFMNLESTSFAPGQMICYDFAVVYGKGIASLGSVTELKVNAELAQTFFDGQNFSCDVVTVGTDELSFLETSMYPNPSSGLVNIVIKQPVDHVRVKVLDLAGRVVYSEDLQNQQEIKLDLNGHKGVYIIQVASSEGTAVERILME